MVSVRVGTVIERVGVGRLVGGGVVLLALVLVAGRAVGLFHTFSVDSPVPGVVAEGDERSGTGTTVDAQTAAALDTTADSRGVAVVVHVAGAVLRPGVYSLPAGSRVVDAVEAAGGHSSEAAPNAVNLAGVLTDGAQVYMPTGSEVAEGWTGVAAGSTTGVVASVSGGVSVGGPVNINSAGVAELDTLPGIGQVTAGKIVADRTANGPFGSLDDLARVSGIGDAKIGALEGLAVAR